MSRHNKYKQQIAQLSPTDLAAGWVSFGQKWKTVFCSQYRSIFNHCDAIGLKAIKFGEIKQSKCYYAVQGYSKPLTSEPI